MKEETGLLRIGLVGADNFHALAFSRLANLPVSEGGCGLPVRVTMLWGESEERAAFVAKEAQIPAVVSDPSEMLGNVDAVMIVLRRGDAHCAAALPFLRAGIPTWVDKPFTTDVSEALQIIAEAQKSGALLAGGSTCKYCPDVLRLRDRYLAMRAQGSVLSAGFNFPGRPDSPYGGLYFYCGHTAEILTTVFGPDVRSVKADVTAGNVIAVFKYDSLAVCVNLADSEQYFGMLYGPDTVEVLPIDTSTIYRHGFEKFVQGVLAGTAPEPYETLVRPVQILNALAEAAETEREVFVAPPRV